ncbi:MAG TPA: creatininase family protein [Streptosporangiaceae bacterium]|nr:creatininase family protein [Streptosporangiaceae bacterium]
MTDADPSLPALFPPRTTAEERDRAAAVAVLPIGSFEQHGPYLPLATDTVIAATIAAAIDAAYRVLRLPPITISCSHEHAAWAGTVSISATTLAAVVGDIADSLHRSGVGTLVLVNGHGGNYVLSNVVQQAGVAGQAMALFPTLEAWAKAHTAAGIVTPLDSDMHAGELETSLLLHAHPHLVRPGYASADHLADDREHLLTLGLAAYTESGVVGRPSLASAEKGRDVLASLVASFGDTLSALGR